RRLSMLRGPSLGRCRPCPTLGRIATAALKEVSQRTTSSCAATTFGWLLFCVRVGQSQTEFQILDLPRIWRSACTGQIRVTARLFRVQDCAALDPSIKNAL